MYSRCLHGRGNVEGWTHLLYFSLKWSVRLTHSCYFSHKSCSVASSVVLFQYLAEMALFPQDGLLLCNQCCRHSECVTYFAFA
jgi:hypothetical protein